MKVYNTLYSIPAFNRAVITIGTFDGVHVGHQQILNQLKEEAAQIGGETVIITFHPHPRKVIQSSKPPIYLINTIEERIELLRNNRIDHLVIIPFTEAFSKLTAEAYVEDFLINKFHPNTVIIGYDHHFGQGRKGDYKLLEEYSNKGAFILKEIPEHLLNKNIVSSTSIREAILKGNIEEANALLGYDFFFEGVVVEGNKLGRSLGYPTANLKIENEEKLVPGNGIYAVEVVVGNREIANLKLQTKSAAANSPSTIQHSRLKGMMSIGVRPTIGGKDRVIEVNIFDFDKNIYGETLRVYVKKYLRPEEKFSGLEELKQQLAIDKENSLKVLGN